MRNPSIGVLLASKSSTVVSTDANVGCPTSQCHCKDVETCSRKTTLRFPVTLLAEDKIELAFL